MPTAPEVRDFQEVMEEKIEENKKYIEAQIVKKDGKTIYFFDKKNKENKHPKTNEKVADGYYRVILGTTAEDNCVIQDFYANNDKKQCEPIIVAKEDCDIFDSKAYEGLSVPYDKEQKADFMAYYKNGKALNFAFTASNRTLYADISDDNKIISKEKLEDAIFVTTYDNEEIKEITVFRGKNVNTFRYSDGQGDFANSKMWSNGEERTMFKLGFDLFIEKVTKDFVLIGTLLNATKKELNK